MNIEVATALAIADPSAAAMSRLATAMEAQRVNTKDACKGSAACHICHVVGCATRAALAPTQPR